MRAERRRCSSLGPDDSLVLFYAGHGGTQTHRLGNQVIKTGYLIPVDASNRAATWIELDGWLRAVSLLPPKHILVILDACHSGIALGPIIKWRDSAARDRPLSTLKARRSRRIITSALDDQVALDSGPVYGHSLFTGCLIEGLTHGLGRAGGRVTTGSELGLRALRIEDLFLLKLASGRTRDLEDLELIAPRTTPDALVDRWNQLIKWHGDRHAILGFADALLDQLRQRFGCDPVAIIARLAVTAGHRALLLEAYHGNGSG